MTSPSPAAERAAQALDRADRDLLIAAAHEAGGELARRYGAPVKTWSKGALGPVTEADLAANAALSDRLRAARPDYGWLSEETPDDAERLSRARAFVVDPLDGTDAFLKGVPEFCVALAVVEAGRPVAGVVHNPITGETFAAAAGAGATRDGAPIGASARDRLEDAALLGPPDFYQDARWPKPWPRLRVRRVRALSYRLAQVASGAADGLVTLGYKAEWDIAAGALLVAEAGGVITDPWGRPLAFNQPDPRGPGAVAAGRALHPLLLDHTVLTPHPDRIGHA